MSKLTTLIQDAKLKLFPNHRSWKIIIKYYWLLHHRDYVWARSVGEIGRVRMRQRSWMFVSGWLLDIIVMLRHTETIQFTEAIFGEWLRHIIQHLCTWTGNSRCSIVINTANAVGPSISDVWMKLTDSFKDVVASRSPSRMTPVVDVRRADHGIRSAGHQPRVGNADTRGQRRRKKRLEIAHETRRQAVQPAVAASQYNVRQQPIVKRRIKRRYHVCDDSRQIQTKVHVFCRLVQLVT